LFKISTEWKKQKKERTDKKIKTPGSTGKAAVDGEGFRA
jgi:hypothetical protein